MTRVLHLISSNQRRGAEVFGVELADELRRRGHDVDVLAVCPSPDGPWLQVEVAGRSRRDPRGAARMIRAARRAEVVVSFGSVSLQAAALASAVARRPFIYRNIGDPAAWHDVRFRQLRVGMPLRRARTVVAVFPDAGERMSDLYGLGAAKVTVIPRGVDPLRFPRATPESAIEARRRLGLDPDRRWLAYVGSLSEEKNPLLAIDAVDNAAGVGLVVAGTGPMSQAVAERARPLADRVHLLGPVPDVRDVLQAVDGLLLTSRTEGVPGVVIEAGLTGRPSIASRVGGVPFAVVDGETGVLVDPDDLDGFVHGIRALLDDADALGDAAYRRCFEHFSMAVVADRWETLLTDASTASS